MGLDPKNFPEPNENPENEIENCASFIRARQRALDASDKTEAAKKVLM